MDTPKIVTDCEILPDKLRVYGNTCIGAKKYERDVLISISHSHGDNTAIQFKNKGFADIILTQEQAVNLFSDLAKIIGDNKESTS